MRVLVTGGRHATDHVAAHAIDFALSELSPELVIQGGAGGVDAIARVWASAVGVPCLTIDAAWGKFGKSAGPIRNKWMLKYGKPDLVVAFPGGRGTESMVRLAEDAGVEVIRETF